MVKSTKLKKVWQILPAITFMCVAVRGAQQGQTTPKGNQQFPPLIRSLEGPDLFRAYCAPCHGLDGRGAGPAASALRVKPPDLTLLSRNNRGEFPVARVRETIMGDQILAAHGSREMPIWGPVFHQVEEDVDRGKMRLENLVEYLELIQTTASSTPVSGAELYKRHCAVCHGNDLKGNGPAPPPFKDFPPDLTTLAQRHGGKFPEAYVMDVLRNGVSMPAHGLTEMPIWGLDFRASEGLSPAQVTSRITELTNYIKSRQAK
jgi:mono/diheme cytochrome c family protein